MRLPIENGDIAFNVCLIVTQSVSISMDERMHQLFSVKRINVLVSLFSR